MTKALFVSFVEDERELYAEVLSSAGFEVQACRDAIQSLAIATDWHPDVVVARILQPGCPIDGLELTSRLRSDSRTRHAAVILITSLSATVLKTAAAEAGADSLLLLPSLPDDFVHEIRRLIGARSAPALSPSDSNRLPVNWTEPT